jgi:phospholipid-binding lipoprotein MlaA
MLPFLGPSTVRDGLGKATDFWAFSIWPYIETDWTYPLLALSIIDERAKFLRHEKVLDVISIDEYLMIRDAYLQNREYRLTGKKDGIEEEPSEVSKSGVIIENGIDDSFFEEAESESGKAEEKTATPSGEGSKALPEDDIEIYEEPNKSEEKNKTQSEKQNDNVLQNESKDSKDEANKLSTDPLKDNIKQDNKSKEEDQVEKKSLNNKQDKVSKEIMDKDVTTTKNADEEQNISWKMLHLMLEVTQK